MMMAYTQEQNHVNGRSNNVSVEMAIFVGVKSRFSEQVAADSQYSSGSNSEPEPPAPGTEPEPSVKRCRIEGKCLSRREMNDNV